MVGYSDKILKAKQYLEDQIKMKPQIGLILGSGLGGLADEIEESLSIPYETIPNFPVSTVEGHAGELVLGKLMGKSVVALKGRFHYYEGYSMDMVVFPVRVMIALGVNTIIVTNAAGGVNQTFTPGDLMIIEDHLNLGFDNPLIGPNDNHLGLRFPDMSQAYDKDLVTLAEKIAIKNKLNVKKGVYAFFTGPTYETPAEVKMAHLLGADAVGMSTVPEVIAAKHGGIKVLGISCITNMAAGILNQPLNHREVIETTQKVKIQFSAYIKDILSNL